MPRGKRIDDGHEANRNSATGRVVAESDDFSMGGLSSIPSSIDRAAEAGQAFIDIITREDGWLRVVGGELNKQCYWKYKFSSGQHKGKYVMYVTVPGQWEEGIIGLAGKILEVDRGERRPAQDTFYDPR